MGGDRGRLPLLAVVVAAACLLPRAAAPGRPCASAPLCRCRADHFSCDYVPFYRFPETEGGVAHVALWAARLGSLAEAALDGRALRTLVLVGSHLHTIDHAAFTPMMSSLASLDLGYNELTEVPIGALRHLKVLNWLNLQNNYINDLDPGWEWGGLSDSLSSLTLSNNHIYMLRDGALSSLRQLVQLELDGNRLRQLDAGALPPGMSILRLSDNLLTNFPCQALFHLPRLRHLHLRNNILQSSTNSTCRSSHSKIDSLDLSHNELSDDFHFDFHHGLQLKQLILDLNDFTTIPTFVADCGRLEKLSVSYNNLQHLSEVTLHALRKSLERLEIDHNDLTALPEGLREMTRLRYLSLSYNRLDDVLELPPKLHTLSLAGNYLATFPSGLHNISQESLVYLDLGYNQISYVGADIFGPWSEGLVTLILRGNRIAQLALGCFPPLALRELILSFNDLYYVEAGVFANLSELRVLELSSALFSGEIPKGSALTALTWLGLDNNNIHLISSDNINNFPSLEYLNLDFNKIIEFPSEVTQRNGSYKLKELRLSYNYISKVNSEFLEELTELQSVDVSYNRMHNISERSFLHLANLVYISLAGNELETIADGAFVNLPNLEVLELQENNLVEFSIGYFVNVSNEDVNLSVNVSYNRIVSLVGGPTAPINVLDLSHNRLETLSKSFFESMNKHITQLLISHNKIVQVDSFAFGSLPNLNTLHLHDNNIVLAKRRAFADLPSLQILDLSRNRIPQLSAEQFHNLRSLRHLKLLNNRLRALPRDAFKNTMIEYLDLSDNQLSLFPNSALTHVGFTLRRLELSRNRIEYLDAAMFHATAFLRELGLARNGLTVLSDNTFSGLPRLRRLDLAFNAIKANFKELFHNAPRLRQLTLSSIGLKAVPHLPLVNLTELNLSNNYINSYSQTDVKYLSSLRALDISGNKFTSLRPAMWSAFTRLITLDVSHNPIVRISKGVFDGLTHLMHLKMTHLQHLENLEPKAFRSLVSLRSLALQSRTGEDRQISIANIIFASPFIESVVILFSEAVLDSQLLGIQAPKLRSLELRGAALKIVAAHAFMSLGRQRSLSLRLTSTGVADLPAGLVLPLTDIPHLALDLSDNHLVGFGAATLYPNLTGWNRLATKLLPGGLVLVNNPLRCGCSATWVGGWLRRWSSEVGGGARAARAAARRATCVSSSPPGRSLIALHADEADCTASALSSMSARARSFYTTVIFLLVFVYSIS